jgi:hypothetical protein
VTHAVRMACNGFAGPGTVAAYRASESRIAGRVVSLSHATLHVESRLPRRFRFAGEHISTVMQFVAALDGLSRPLLNLLSALSDFAGREAHPRAFGEVLPQRICQVGSARGARVTTRQHDAWAELVTGHGRRATGTGTDRVIMTIDDQRRSLVRRQHRRGRSSFSGFAEIEEPADDGAQRGLGCW